MSTSQTLLASLILLAAAGTFKALSPPNPSTRPAPRTGDTLQLMGKTSVIALFLTPFGLLALHTAALAYFYNPLDSSTSTTSTIPSWIYGYGKENGLDVRLITWSPLTITSLFLVLGIGVPIRLASYAGLGKNFTFALAEPDRLVTSGVYRYLQHPSYTGTVVLGVGMTILLCRIDGAPACWIPPAWFGTAQVLWWWFTTPGFFAFFLWGVWKRVSQEERMMKQGKFGKEWEAWHRRTPRFVPGVF